VLAGGVVFLFSGGGVCLLNTSPSHSRSCAAQLSDSKKVAAAGWPQSAANSYTLPQVSIDGDLSPSRLIPKSPYQLED